MVRALARGGGESEGLLGSRPGSVVVAGVCAVLAGILLFAGVEATDNPTAVTLTPARVASADDLGSRTYATIEGSIVATYVETFTDDNGNGTQESGEDGISWFYFLVDPATHSGVTVRSSSSPDELFTLDAAGIVLADAEYIAEDVTFFADEATALGFTLDRTRYLDSTAPVAATTPVVDLADGIPGVNTAIRISDARAGGYLEFCSGDANRNGTCDNDEVDLWDVAVFDPGTGNAITVLVDENPEYTKATFTGMLRRDERSVSEAKTTKGLGFSTLGLDVSDVYLMEAGSAPASAPIAFGSAALLGVLAAVILIGLVGGYLIYRKSTGPLPDGATTVGVGERIPLRVTGLLRSGGGLVHVREAPADLVRFQLTDGAAPPVDALAAVPSTLILERRGRAEGVALGLGELTRISRGSVLPFRGRRPALRVIAGTGQLLLSFDSDAVRDRAVAELLDETGLTRSDNGSARA